VATEREHRKSKANRIVEDAGLAVLLKDGKFQAPSTGLRKSILRHLGLDGTKDYGHRSFDAIMLPNSSQEVSEENLGRYLDDIVLVEMKTTEKPIKDENLFGFFFGATEREFKLAEKLGDRYRFAFVVLNSNNIYGKPFAVLLSLEELRPRIRSDRIQRQINLFGAKSLKRYENRGMLVV
jgi:hypothetical protein